MFHGQKYSLEVYKRFSDKILLLDSALETMDGNIIINFQEMADLYMATGNNANMKQVYYLIGKDISNKDILYKRLEHFTVEHMPKVNNNADKLEFSENMQMLQWQIERKETQANSVIEQLALLCKSEWEKNKNANETIMDFKKRLRIDDFAYEWTVMNVMASMQLWPQLTATFIKPNWLTKKNALKTVMNPEIFVHGLSRHNPPKEVLEQYLSCISDSDKSLYLAQKLNCHKFVIQYYINQRDRLALINAKLKVTTQSEEYFLIENALQSSDKKWKN
ncbi:hypothetical protein NQ317_006220 [Molorchus minor]|uniref:Vps16 C-terminal domain-containing protein n=1 Tax=Molorchus minor TaxID=1323400 RepID=A0ABQ9K6B7_9CUCU|nr:hypothetical protein NQ317_006220 [Molorchus minor]